MKSIIALLRPALVATAILLVVVCGIYPVAVRAVGRLAFREKADGSLIVDRDGTVRGSRLIAQPFSGTGYFHPRPSAAGVHGYDAANSRGSHLGPTSRKLAEQIKARIAAYRAENGLSAQTPVPADAVTASASGLDPHISPRNAQLQSARVARERGLPESAVGRLIRRHTVGPQFGLLGAPGVNVLELNRDLDAL
ncbi:MAG TPA: K(+)-transporting ATPase subunit C [Chthoniobacteraceae bacterium]|nr:K(+)-transporting ATPase subunit C [Chthoniobacteraceae bacterium]